MVIFQAIIIIQYMKSSEYIATCYIHKILRMYYTIHVCACNYTITYYGYICAN